MSIIEVICNDEQHAKAIAFLPPRSPRFIFAAPPRETNTTDKKPETSTKTFSQSPFTFQKVGYF
ncbi:MAG: hypothetical protein WD555_02845 [Fulvivirga sp.]